MPRFRPFGILLLLLFFTSSLSAQKDSTTSNDSLRFDKYYLYSGILDARDEVVAPFHWQGKQWLTFSALAAGESAMIFAGGDKNVQLFAQRNRNSTTNFIENNIGDPFGDGLYPAIIIGSTYIIGCAFHNNHLKQMAMVTAKSVVISALVTTVVKDIAERERPYQNTPANPLLWNGPVGKFGDNSFPSGHTTVAFATATSIALLCPHPLIIPVLAYSLATVTAFGRINGNYHWGSDVIIGAAIGYFTSKLIYSHNNWRKCLINRNMRHNKVNAKYEQK